MRRPMVNVSIHFIINQIANFACDVMAAMLVMNNKNISVLWELNSIFM